VRAVEHGHVLEVEVAVAQALEQVVGERVGFVAASAQV
jgi:hypothetical protein